MTPASEALNTARPARRKPSLALRIGVAVTLVVALAATAALFSAWRYGWQAANEAFDRLLTGASLQIVERIGVVDDSIVVDIPASAFELLALAREDRVFYRVIGPDGTTLTGYDDLPALEVPEDGGTEIYETQYSGETVRAAVTGRQLVERNVSGLVTVVVAHTMRERTVLAHDIATKAAILVGAASLAIIALALAGVLYGLSPLTRVERALLSRDPNDLSPFEIETPREIETVVDAINRFTRRLDRRIGSVQAFVADAAHQLRTPITAIRAQAEIAAEEKDPERLARLNKRILDRAIGVSRLADQLLSHAMVTHRADAEPRELLDLRRIAMEAEEESQRLGDADLPPPKLDLPDEEVLIAGDRFSLREAVKNLINNAQTHGKAPVSINVRMLDGFARVSVSDFGRGIPADRRDQAGERFRGGGASRTGAGLGLAIVAEVAQSHGGKLEFADLPGGAFEAAIILPTKADQ
ncbi:sensor histidine kinase [Mesorhizobium sp. Z1-4]|uniref:sensor histidine kinase n=1 Tax=Mesorhizobium sp. Z1-4 TaxID=2448478 RepID=UPI000FDA31DE|nr:sensor histidine kinase [Mesorhizobium sp. Z1-4]